MGRRKLYSLVLLFVLAMTLVVAVSCKGDPKVEEESLTSEVGVTYVHTDTKVTWASEEAKNEKFEDAFKSSTVIVEFKEGNSATVVYSIEEKGETKNLFYKVIDGKVFFYETKDDMVNNKEKNDGWFAAEFKLSNDFTKFQWIAADEKCNITLTCTVKK